MSRACDWCPFTNSFVCEGHCGQCSDEEIAKRRRANKPK